MMQDNNPLVSIIIPVFRIERYIRDCIASVIRQTYENLQIIVVDDGSDDNCPQICDEVAKEDSRIQVIHKINGGLSSARNAGLDVVEGDYIYFVDGDDLINEKCIERLLSILIDYDGDIVQSKTYAFIEPSKLPPRFPDAPTIECYTGKQYCRILFDGKLGTDGGVVWNKLYKKSFFEDMRFPEGMLYEDDATVYRLYWSANRVLRTNEPLSYYRSRRSGSIMHTGKIRYEDMISIRKLQRDFFCTEKEEELANQARYLLANEYAMARADSKYVRECGYEIKKQHLRVIEEVKSGTIAHSKRFMNIIGYVFPKVWLALKIMKRYLKRTHRRLQLNER